MRVYIGPYKKWWGPYQLAELIPFVSENTQDKIADIIAKTWITNICNWYNELKENRKIKVRIDEYDTWNMDNTLAHVTLPMLKQLQKNKHGSPKIDDDDLPPHMRYGDPDGEDNWVHYRWEWIINEMIFAFENILDDSWEDYYRHGEPVYEFETIDDNYKVMKQTNPDYWIDWVGYEEYNKRINNGFRLFGKYYRSLWD